MHRDSHEARARPGREDAALPRRLAIYAVEHPIFDPLILTTIIANCATMAWDSPLDAGHGLGTARAGERAFYIIR